MDINNLYNPYDFANPVSDVDLFVGRENEMETIKYYLKQAKNSPRPINIALMGPRAAGKTSILNMIECEAVEEGFCVVRIDLDESDVTSQLAFFYKLFDCLFTEVCRNNNFGGLEGKTYDVYLDMVNSFQIPADKTFSPFIFPIQYGKALGSGNPLALLSDHNFKHDLVKIHDEIDCPIILLFDECNVLGNSRIHLQKLRNIFMSLPGYMLVFTGTPDLFPVMDEIFSPIVRQFKKIEVIGFKEEKDTLECIIKPLEKIGIIPEEIFDLETFFDVAEIHDVSSGRPYEIQLICHMLFKRIQTKRSKKMKLDISVLEDVRKELENSQDLSTRPILSIIRRLGKKQLEALSVLCPFDGRASFDEVWGTECVFNKEKYWTKEELQSQLNSLENDGILSVDREIIQFNGDEFDKIYIKYFARELKVHLKFIQLPLNIYWYIMLQKEFSASHEVLMTNDLYDIKSVSEKLAKLDEDVFSETPGITQELYFLMLENQNASSLEISKLIVNLPWLELQLSLILKKNTNDNIHTPFSHYIKDSVLNNISDIGGRLTIETDSIPVIPIEKLIKSVEKTANERSRMSIIAEHMNLMVEQKKHNNLNRCIFHAEIAFKYDPTPDNANNLGYLFILSGETEKAKILFQSSLTPIAYYNLAVMDLKSGNFKNANNNIDKCIENIHICLESGEDVDECACLIVPEKINNQLIYEEGIEPDLHETAVLVKSIVLEMMLISNKDVC